MKRRIKQVFPTAPSPTRHTLTFIFCRSPIRILSLGTSLPHEPRKPIRVYPCHYPFGEHTHVRYPPDGVPRLPPRLRRTRPQRSALPSRLSRRTTPSAPPPPTKGPVKQPRRAPGGRPCSRGTRRARCRPVSS